QKYVIESGLHWGEWCEPGVDGGKELVQPKQELTAAYMHYSMRLLAEMLRQIGREEEAAQCGEYSQGAKKAYHYYFVKDGHINAPRQAPMVRALALGLLDGETAESVAADLNADAIRRNYTVGTGFLSTPFVLSILVQYGYVDTAYKMLENTVAPGWLAMVEQGATTVWENCNGYDEEGHPVLQSMNHYSPGAVCAFLFETVCGIHVAGENKFYIAPVSGGTLTEAEGSYDSPYGRVSCSWKKTEGKVCYSVAIPANTTAEVVLPGKAPVQLESGNYEFLEE
ncbi:MAG: alfa-L-rhamnosidase, partial [Roseburia sp.]|nr:alfa-L-rhamnosidase [Roseburia sp.]MCM1099743.1 alfa-L-rhamnosidase [Ruminococcus flavefaciens]